MQRSLLIATGAALFACPLGLAAADAPSPPEVWASVETTAGPRWHGRLETHGDKLTLTEAGGAARDIDPASLTLIEFNPPRPPTETGALANGALPAPWKTGTVGELPRGGSAEVKNGSIILETSSPDREAQFGSFYTTYRPLPEGEAHITARVTRIDTYEEETRSGIVIRDGTGADASTVFLALSHRSPASMVCWEKLAHWNGSSSGDIPIFCSPLITRETPGQSTEIDVDVTGAKKLFLVVQDGGDGMDSDWATWADPRIIVDGEETRLTDRPWVSATSGFGAVGNGENVTGGDLKMGDEPVASGFGTHANSLIEFDLPRGTTRFRSSAGIDPAGGLRQASVRFMVFSQRPKAAVSKIRPGAHGLRLHSDTRNDSRPGHWLRLVRKAGRITGYLSSDGGFWRELWSVEDKMKPAAYAGLVGQGRKPRRRWGTVFDHVQVGPVKALGTLNTLEPKIALVDGTIFHEKIESATPTLIRLGGANTGRVIPAISIARIQFYQPLDSGFDEFLSGRREGVLLSNGDFFEGKLEAIEDGSLAVRSTLFGARQYDLGGSINALVLRPAAKKAPPGLPYSLETWRGGRLYGKAIRVEGEHLAIDTVRLRTQRFALSEVKRVTKSDR